MKYECEGQISLFDSIVESSVKTVDDYAEEAIMRGTGFTNGKKRVYEMYQRDMTKSDRADAIKKEYGLGGAGWPLEGYGLHGYDSFYRRGLRLKFRDELGEHVEIVPWKRVEQIIQRLVESGKYYAPPN